MKITTISGLVFNVKNLDETAAFYNLIGFPVARHENYILVKLNAIWLEFWPRDGADERILSVIKGPGLAIAVSAVDQTYKEIVNQNLQPLTAPQNFSWGRREFTVCDPDGYELTFYSEINPAE